MFGKFYCKKCNRIKNRFQIKRIDMCYYYGYECRYCHENIETLDEMLVRLNKEIEKIFEKISFEEQLKDFHEWINSEAKKIYPDNAGKQRAFKSGVYSLLDKLNIDYSEE